MSPSTTIDAREAAHFGAQAADWWNPQGSSAMLHRINPVRLGYIRDAADRHWRLDPRDRRPLTGKRALDVGCGAGLLAEPLGRLGADVTGLDAAPEAIEAARRHAAGQGLAIDYRAGGVESLAGQFDLITAMEVIEHVADRALFAGALARLLGPGGLLVMSTPNRTARSRLMLVEGAERLGLIPRGTHRWEHFLTPGELESLLGAAGLRVTDVTGLEWGPASGFRLGPDVGLNYLVSAIYLPSPSQA